MSEMKENRFRRIAGARVNKIINMLKLLGNCSHTGNYSYTKQQVEEIFGRLRSEVDEAYKRYQMCMKNAHLFSLSEESESAYPSASLLLPNGSLLTAKAIDDDNFPAIDVVLLSKNEEEKICFVEFNPERERGRELCIGVYCRDSDETTYYQAPRRPRREWQRLHKGSQLHFVERQCRQAGHPRVASKPRTLRQRYHAQRGRGQKSLCGT